MEAIKSRLKGLMLTTMAQNLEHRNQYAQEHKITYLEFLELLVEDQWASRQDNAYRNRLRESGLSEQKTLDRYDFSYQPALDKRSIMELASGRFIDERKNVIFMGKPGVGKTHLANALGYEAIKRGKKVWMVHASELTARLFSSKADGSYKSFLMRLIKLDLLIIDELGFKRIPPGGQEDFFEVIRLRYEQGSLVVTTNRNFEDWAALFGDAILASAIIDRLVHHASIVKITGSSYRIKDLLAESGGLEVKNSWPKVRLGSTDSVDTERLAANEASLSTGNSLIHKEKKQKKVVDNALRSPQQNNNNH